MLLKISTLKEGEVLDKNKRARGEELLKNWGKNLIRIEHSQNKLNNLRKNRDIFESLSLAPGEKRDIISCCDEFISIELDNLKKNIKKYMVVDNVVDSLEENQRDIIRLRYILGKSWQEIAFQTHMCLRNCFHIKNFVINEVLERFDEVEKCIQKK